MKTAKHYIASYHLECPHCGEPLSDEKYGSHIFEAGISYPPVIKCDTCGKESKHPTIKTNGA